MKNMGDRAVIAFGINDKESVGIYLHWHGHRSKIKAYLEAARTLGIRDPLDDNYGIARLTQIIANYFRGDGLSIGVDTLCRLDCDNGDNGTFIIGPKFTIAGLLYQTTRSSKDVEMDQATYEGVLAANKYMYEVN